MINRENQLTPNQFDNINYLYWDEGYDQYELADIFNCNQSHISRIVNSKACGFHCSLVEKLSVLNKNIKPLKNEAVQARTLRAKRESLPSNKLSWKDVSLIRKLFFLGMTQNKLAARFKVNQSTISRIISGLKWKKIK